tara:strand:+ start:1310 stop:1696 length:387 start_codon:yes stop_codon:yes gene_type:complete
MKYLQDYMEEKQTKLFKETGTFFAFSDKQYEEQADKTKTYVYMGAGMYTLKKYAKDQIEKHYQIYNNAIKQDIKENGKDKIILRELLNHEAYYTNDLEQTIETLKDYPFSEDDISHIYQKNYGKYINQ